jgi:hypothetical protein
MTGFSPTEARLWELLPAVYRVRDADTGGVLADLVSVLAAQVDVLAEEVEQLADDRFIETAAVWAAPYLGELVGYRAVRGDVPGVGSSRAEVANTVGYRRRKGTAAVVEQVARDVTRWPARVVESFETLVTTQYMNHVRLAATATPDVRDHAALGWIGTQGGAFDDLDRTADVRAVDAAAPSRPGRYGIRELALFLWRTTAVPWERTPLVPVDDRRLRFDPLGADTQLFALPRAETDIVHLAEPRDVPQPLGRRWTAAHATAVYGPPVTGARRSILLETQTGAAEPQAVPAARVRFCDLSDVPGGGGAWHHEPAGDAVAIDPVLGRVYLGTAPAPGARLLGSVAFGVGVPAGVGDPRPVAVAAPAPVVDGSGGEDLQPLLDAVEHGGTVRLLDTDRYAHPLTLTARTGPTDQPEVEVRLEAGPRARPTLVLEILRVAPEPRTTVVLQGLLVAGGPVVLDEVGDTERRTIVIRDCTLVPGAERTGDGQPAHPEQASLIVLDPAAVVRIERSILGPIVAVEGARVEIVDSIVDASSRTSVAICGRPRAGGVRTVTTPADMVAGDGLEPAGDVSLSATTVVGGIRCTILDASNSLLVAALAATDARPAAVFAERRQTGCLRYTYVPDGSRTGRRFHCAPDPDDTLHEQRATRPRFDAMRFGDPGYLRLRTGTHPRIRRGADDESEMGVTHRDYVPQREANLVIRFDEYLRLGLSAGRFTAT